MRRARTLAFACCALAAGLAGWLVHTTTRGPQAADPVETDARPEFRLPDLDGRPRAVGEWDGKVLVINFWATWCPPCREEIPGFVALQEQLGPRGLQFLGIAIDERAAVAEYAGQMGINYPILIGEADAAAVGEAYGNTLGALPYSVVVDRSGRIVYRRRGKLSEEALRAVVEGLL